MNKISPWRSLIYAAVSLAALACLLPMLLVVAISLTDESSLAQKGYSFFPEALSLDAYTTLIRGNSTIGSSYLISIIVTLAGTCLAVLITASAGYALANRQVNCRRGASLYFFIPMVFNAGLVPWYMICRELGLTNNIFSLIIPTLLFSPFNLFLTRNFMIGIPDALGESAKMDGANDLFIAFRIYFPLSKPVLATIALFYGIGYWNDWFNSVMLVSDKRLYTLQFFLYNLQSEISAFKYIAQGVPVKAPPQDTFKMAAAVVTIGPIILLYPFLQKYFVKGLVVGGVKE
ncbi:MAG: carbohydrate ABC transporter permease [Clostridiales bacterium]|nr:carbohydrate ABC transporter permease [Clostridiales bacterium]